MRSKNNKATELKLIQTFKGNRITGWKRNYIVKGHPDFDFLDRKIAIFIDGYFRCRHDCTCSADNAEYWVKRRDRNMQHDKKSYRYLNNRDGRLFGFGNVSLSKKSGITNKLAPHLKK